VRIAAGVLLGQALPGLFAAIAAAQVAQVNLVVAALIWLMIVPMLLKIDFAALGAVRQHWKGVGVTLLINWAVKLFSMALPGAVHRPPGLPPGCRRGRAYPMLPG
jgi:ACR3 family arsenite transporter